MDPQTIVVKLDLDEALPGRSLSTMGDSLRAELAIRKQLGRAIAARRSALQLSQEGLAGRAGISRTYVSEVERGEQTPSSVVLVRLADALKTTAGALLGETTVPESLPDPRLSPARNRVSRLRQEAEALYRLLQPETEPLEAAGPRIVGIDEVGTRKKRTSAVSPPDGLVRLPIVGERLAAGRGSWPERPDEELQWLTFRETWAALGYPKDERRYVLAKLGDESIADSMSPEILPRSLLLLDRSDAARIEIEDGKPYLCVVDGKTDEPALAVKKVERVFRGRTVIGLKLVSPNKERHPEIHVDLEEDQPIQHVVRARVVWWATTVE